MTIKQAIFAGSCTNVAAKPARKLPEFAFIGRSNVGKSSLINLLCDNRKLAKTSSTPGKTQLINHFLINDRWYLVDLPGYGYARMSQEGRDRLRRMIEGYISQSEELVVLFVLIDCRHDIGKIDLDFIHRLGENGIPFAILFTKRPEGPDRTGQGTAASGLGGAAADAHLVRPGRKREERDSGLYRTIYLN